MNITFIGATHEVTGSNTLIECSGKNIMVDCGMQQGVDVFESIESPVPPPQIDFVFLTHAHIDHSGLLPLLYKRGFRGTVFATPETISLCDVMLRDSANIQMSEAEYSSRKAARAGEEPAEPLYDLNDVAGLMPHFRPCSYGEMLQICECVKLRFTDIGHLLGSACIEIWLEENGVEKKIVFSGDVGNTNQPIINDPKTVEQTDYLVIESTYGDRLHDERQGHIQVLADYIKRTLDRGGNVIIPSFAVGRTQEMLYFIREIKSAGLVPGHEDFPVYVDSPLANEATSVLLQCGMDCLDEETRAIMARGENPLVFQGLHTYVSVEESKQLNFDTTPKVIISANGMCTAGRIRHHLKYNLWRPESLILFVGYQSKGTLGRLLLEGAKSVRLFGDTIAVKAEIAMFPGISGHADKQGLLNWLSGFEQKPGQIFVNHGDDAVCESFVRCLNEEHGYNAFAPYSGTVYDLAAGEFVKITKGIPVKKISSGRAAQRSVLERLIASAKKLLRICEQSEGRANKDLAKYADQIDALCEKMSR